MAMDFHPSRSINLRCRAHWLRNHCRLPVSLALFSPVTESNIHSEHAAKPWFGPKFLNQQESDFIVARIEKDRSDAIAEPFQLSKYLRTALDLKVWVFAALFGLTCTIAYAIAFFLPIILRDGMGFSTAEAQCLVAPPYVAAAIVMYAMAWAGDKYHIRSPFILINGVLALVGTWLLSRVLVHVTHSSKVYRSSVSPRHLRFATSVSSSPPSPETRTFPAC